MSASQSITDASKAVFLAYAKDAGNWGGTPLVGPSGNVCTNPQEERGNLTQLKRAGLIETWKSDGHVWLRFTEAGKKLAADLGESL